MICEDNTWTSKEGYVNRLDLRKLLRFFVPQLPVEREIRTMDLGLCQTCKSKMRNTGFFFINGVFGTLVTLSQQSKNLKDFHYFSPINRVHLYIRNVYIVIKIYLYII